MNVEEVVKFDQLLENDKFVRETSAVDIGKKLQEADEYEITKIY